ncbi:hypothetical protein ACD591_17740 [Rufibacter glacialis]|nr:hypothetical protein [Rufibacter glacialis]GGK85812.1 hypothetical protein GCM10011405_37070 [Rufibacter glacialis]
MAGAAIPVTKASHWVVNGSLVVETRQNYLLALRSYSHGYEETDDGQLKNTAWYGSNLPMHNVEELNLTVGKSRDVHQRIALSLSTGPSLVRYQMPHNIKTVTSGGWGGILNSSYYEYDVRTYWLPGWSIRGDMVLAANHAFGLSIGGVFNYNSKMPNGGLNLNFLVGKLGPKKK